MQKSQLSQLGLTKKSVESPMGLTKKKELFTTTPSTDTCRGGKNQLLDLFSQPQ